MHRSPWLGLILLLLVACGSSPATQAPTNAATAPTITPTASPTSKAGPPPTLAATATPPPSPTATVTSRPATATGVPPTPTVPRVTATDSDGLCQMTIPAGFAEDAPGSGYFPALDKSGFVALDSPDTAGGANTFDQTLVTVLVTLKTVLPGYRETNVARAPGSLRVEFTATPDGGEGRGVAYFKEFGPIVCGGTLFLANASALPFDATLQGMVASLQVVKGAQPRPTPTPPPPTPAAPTATPGPAKTPGKGQAVFGTDYTETAEGFEVSEPRTTFAIGETVAYVVLFKEAAQTTAVQRFVVSVSANGSETIVDNRPTNISDPSFNLLAGRLPTTGMKAGTYKLKYVRGTSYQAANLLAEGTFTLSANAVAPAPGATGTAPLPKIRERGESKAFAAFVHEVVDNAPPLKYSTGRCCLAEPKAGNRWIALDISIENTSAGEVSIIVLYGKLKTTDNRDYEGLRGSFEPELLTGVLAPGETTRGWIFFEIPVGAQPSTFTYAPGGEAAGSRVTIDLKP